MTPRLSRLDLALFGLVVVAILAIYLPGLGNPLVFDDAYLSDRLLEDHRNSPALRVRALSYGSFVWLLELLGEGWWKQRLVNLAIHVGVVAALVGLYREILRAIAVTPAAGAAPGAETAGYDKSPALWLAIAFFALNPVAVYGVAYLVQRSILMATLFVVLGLWLFARGLARRQPWLHAPALACYALALASKEHAVLAPLAAVPLYIVVARPSLPRLAALAGAGAVLVGAAAFLFLSLFGEIIGKPFDEFSHIYLKQLSRLDPGALANAYPLSIMNQAYLFFEYGLRWFLPWSGWMSIQMRPPFPVSFATFPHVLGVLGYASVVVGGFFLVLRYRDWRALLGLSVLFPALLFATEFAIVWVQDPFVLYRSYLWAIGVPGIVFILVHGPSPRVLMAIGLVAGCLLAWQAMERVISMSSPERVYTDAIEKLPDDPRAVGRWFPYLNRGNAYFDRNQYELALRDFEASAALGDEGMGKFNAGSIFLLQGKPREALAAFDEAQKQGYTLYNLPFQRGMALLALRRPAEAVGPLEEALKQNPPPQIVEGVLLHLGRANMELGKPAEAAAALERLLALSPRNKEGRYLLAMASISKGDPARALEILDALLQEGPHPGSYYARALANFSLKRKAQAQADIDTAINLGLDNPNVRQWQAKIRAMP